MGTSAALPFPNLIDCYYELMLSLSSSKGFMHCRFIDDMFLIHPAPKVCDYLCWCYEHFNKQEPMDFLMRSLSQCVGSCGSVLISNH